MDITFVVGNGFDINLGLNTRYSDFYPYFIKNARNDNMIKKWVESEWNPNEDKNWSDLEIELGDKTKLISKDTKDKFILDLLELDSLLLDYLEEEQNRVVLEGKAESLSNEFQKSFSAIIEGLMPTERDFIQANSSEDFYYNFITFNYTTVLDDMFLIAKKKKPIIGTHTVNMLNTYEKKERYGTICHIHGTLNSGMILGVNDSSQISNESLRSDASFLKAFIKVRMNEISGQKKMDQAESIIKRSKIIFLFGVSMGATDNLWWKRIIKWLKENEDARLIIFHRCNENEKKQLKRKIPTAVDMVNEKWKQDFLNRGGISQNNKDYELLAPKIFILYDMDAEIFEFRNYSILETAIQEKNS